MYRPYSIYEFPFNPLSGGIRVMWGLFGHLLAKGQLVVTNASWNADFTAIYPEIIHGNPLNAPHIVRYILNKPGFMASYGVAGPTTFDKREEIYVFSRIYDTFNVDDDHILFLPILNLNLFKNEKRKRDKTCYFVGKGKDMGLHPKDAVRVQTSDQGELSALLNSCKVMYTYENPTAMIEIARLCGCRVVYFSQGSATNYTRKELTELYEPGMEGVSFDKDEEIQLDSRKFRERYISIGETFSKRLDTFIERTQS